MLVQPETTQAVSNRPQPVTAPNLPAMASVEEKTESNQNTQIKVGDRIPGFNDNYLVVESLKPMQPQTAKRLAQLIVNAKMPGTGRRFRIATV